MPAGVGETVGNASRWLRGSARKETEDFIDWLLNCGGEGGKPGPCPTGVQKYVGKTVGKAEHVKSAEVEAAIASAVGGVQLEDNEPLDVRITSPDGREHAVEVKSLLKGSKQGISVHPDALVRKVDYQEAHPDSTFHTVVSDERQSYEGGAHADSYSGNRLYYKRGNDRYTLAKMHPVKNEKELKALIEAKDEDLPESARGSLPSGEAAKNLRVQAEKSHTARLAKDRARKARLKAEGKSAYEIQT